MANIKRNQNSYLYAILNAAASKRISDSLIDESAQRDAENIAKLAESVRIMFFALNQLRGMVEPGSEASKIIDEAIAKVGEIA